MFQKISKIVKKGELQNVFKNFVREKRGIYRNLKIVKIGMLKKGYKNKYGVYTIVTSTKWALSHYEAKKTLDFKSVRFLYVI